MLVDLNVDIKLVDNLKLGSKIILKNDLFSQIRLNNHYYFL